MALTGIYGHVDRSDAIAIVRRALDLGVDHFDTAELYGPYTNEELIGEALGLDSNRVTIATKFGYRIEEGRIVGLDSRPESIRPRLEASLRRLRRDAVDLLYQHRPDPDVPIEDVVGAMADLVQDGKVRSIGLSGADINMFRRAEAVHAIAAVQNEYSILSRTAEDLLEVVGSAGATFVAFSPLGRGRLAGHALPASERSQDDYRIRSAEFSREALVAIGPTISVLSAIALEKVTNPASVALAWLLAVRPNIIAIPGARSLEQIEICYAASDVQLSANEIERLSAAAPSIG